MHLDIRDLGCYASKAYVCGKVKGRRVLSKYLEVSVFSYQWFMGVLFEFSEKQSGNNLLLLIVSCLFSTSVKFINLKDKCKEDLDDMILRALLIWRFRLVVVIEFGLFISLILN